MSTDVAARGDLFVITAPSGVGKSTLIKRMLSAVPRLSFSVSWTTRGIRSGEQDGHDYRFTDADRFRRMIDEGAFLEWAEVHGNYYGTVSEEVEAALSSGRDMLLDIDVQGALQVRRGGIGARFIFILPPDYKTLEQRLRDRGTEEPRTRSRRLENAVREIREFRTFDFIVINASVDEAVVDLVSIVTAARARSARRMSEAERIVATFPAFGQDGSPGGSSA